MAKHLIYLGETPERKHRVALFDDSDLFVRALPVKDVYELPDVPMANCKVIQGKPYPNLSGSKVVCMRCGVGGYSWSQRTDAHPDSDAGFRVSAEIHMLREPDTVYSALMYSRKETFNWDGKCLPTDWYAIACVAKRMSARRLQATVTHFCIDSFGRVALLTSRDAFKICDRKGRVIDAGAHSGCARTSRVPHRPVIDMSSDERVALHRGVSRRACTDTPSDKVFAVWGFPSTMGYVGFNTAVFDFRGYCNAKVFKDIAAGTMCVAVFPDSTEEIWLDFIRDSPGLRFVYLPRSVDTVRCLGAIPRRVSQVTFYSDSPAVKSFAEKHGAPVKTGMSADDAVKAFYASSDSGYVDVQDAAGLAVISGVSSQRYGDVMAAISFSCQETGFAEDILRERFPIVHVIDRDTDFQNPRFQALIPGTYLVARRTLSAYKPKPHIEPLWRYPDTPYAAAILRLFTAALTLFYPLWDGDDTEPDAGFEVFDLGEYRLYNRAGHWGVGTVLIERVPSARVIHRFKAPAHVIRALLWRIGADVEKLGEPCGVMRYADKLPAIYSWAVGGVSGAEGKGVIDAIKSTLFPVLYGTRRMTRQLLGIDLHTGCFVTALFTKTDTHFLSVKTGWFPCINRLSGIETHAQDWDVSELLQPGCAYLSHQAHQSAAV
jgi:hypothetical protein